MKNCCNFWRHASSQASVRRVYTWRVRMMNKPTFNYHYDWNCLMHLYVRNLSVCLKFTCNPSKSLHDNLYSSTHHQAIKDLLPDSPAPSKKTSDIYSTCLLLLCDFNSPLFVVGTLEKPINNVGARSDPTSPTAKASARRAAEGTPPNNSAASQELAAWAPIKQI